MKDKLTKTIVTASNIVIGKEVIDEDDIIGTIKEYDKDLHNVHVEYKGGGSGLYCLNKGCKDNLEVEGNIFDFDQYDPLYYFN